MVLTPRLCDQHSLLHPKNRNKLTGTTIYSTRHRIPPTRLGDILPRSTGDTRCAGGVACSVLVRIVYTSSQSVGTLKIDVGFTEGGGAGGATGFDGEWYIETWSKERLLFSSARGEGREMYRPQDLYRSCLVHREETPEERV